MRTFLSITEGLINAAAELQGLKSWTSRQVRDSFCETWRYHFRELLKQLDGACLFLPSKKHRPSGEPPTEKRSVGGVG